MHDFWESFRRWHFVRLSEGTVTCNLPHALLFSELSPLPGPWVLLRSAQTRLSPVGVWLGTVCSSCTACRGSNLSWSWFRRTGFSLLTLILSSISSQYLLTHVVVIRDDLWPKFLNLYSSFHIYIFYFIHFDNLINLSSSCSFAPLWKKADGESCMADIEFHCYFYVQHLISS